MTHSEIEKALTAYHEDQTKVFRMMAGERGLDYDKLTPEEYRLLIIEEAEWSEKIARSPACPPDEAEEDRKYAKDLREIASKII
jgi:hypothetical protein